MSNTLYPPDKNPAVALYDLWHLLLSAHGDLTRPSRSKFPEQTDERPNQYGHDSWSKVMPRIAYGDKGTAIGVSGWDSTGRPIFVFGQWYSRRYGIYGYMEVRADGSFRVFHPHGDNHNRIEQNTFLGYGWRGGNYVWYVSLAHGPGQAIDTRDFHTRKPWVYESAIKMDQNHYRANKNWMVLVREGDEWFMRSTEPGSIHEGALIHHYNRAERLYRKAENKHYRALGQKPPKLSVRVGKKVLSNDDAVRQIAVMLDVNAPAKVSPRPNVTEEVMA